METGRRERDPRKQAGGSGTPAGTELRTEHSAGTVTNPREGSDSVPIRKHAWLQVSISPVEEDSSLKLEKQIPKGMALTSARELVINGGKGGGNQCDLKNITAFSDVTVISGKAGTTKSGYIYHHGPWHLGDPGVGHCHVDDQKEDGSDFNSDIYFVVIWLLLDQLRLNGGTHLFRNETSDKALRGLTDLPCLSHSSTKQGSPPTSTPNPPERVQEHLCLKNREPDLLMCEPVNKAQSWCSAGTQECPRNYEVSLGRMERGRHAKYSETGSQEKDLQAQSCCSWLGPHWLLLSAAPSGPQCHVKIKRGGTNATGDKQPDLSSTYSPLWKGDSARQ
ncbi:hypothetical protein EK904_005200 [Melospiza melodia maxima]|nr:hypothetical protein EK904_005200 [Melospiza melodia maxima]